MWNMLVYNARNDHQELETTDVSMSVMGPEVVKLSDFIFTSEIMRNGNCGLIILLLLPFHISVKYTFTTG